MHTMHSCTHTRAHTHTKHIKMSCVCGSMFVSCTWTRTRSQTQTWIYISDILHIQKGLWKQHQVVILDTSTFFFFFSIFLFLKLRIEIKRKTKMKGMVLFRPIITAGKGVNLHNVYRLRFFFPIFIFFLIKNFFLFLYKQSRKTNK